jgi:uncharacterized membrane protein YdjX (TVP38/TMEM64 family)
MSGDGTAHAKIAAAAALLAAALVVALGIVLWRALAERGIDLAALSPEDVERFVKAWGPWSALGAVALMVAHSFLPLPAEIIPVVNGMMFGPWLGIALTWLGAMLGAVLSFALARALGRPFVRLVLPERHWRRIDSLSPRAGPLLVVRLVPVISFNLVNYAAGVLDIPWWTFLWTTALGILPLTVALVLIGGRIARAPLWAWLLFAAVLVLLWLLVRRRRAD